MKLKQWQNIFHVIVSANSIVCNSNRIIKHIKVNVKIRLYKCEYNRDKTIMQK